MSADKKTEDAELLIVVVCNGMSGGELALTLEALKTSSKSIGSHKRRELYYGKPREE